ncbi:peptidase inhibitor family I36 protein [Streptomyces sp. NPDC006012]|uniref:peptidase inhibitor family I36 protein n=1 Tax=Streptomyces sp. NPDC006012 TaxID=3364739 RepID=UPI0036D03EBC
MKLPGLWEVLVRSLRSIALSAVATAVTALSLATPNVAHAATSGWSTCPSTYFCVWNDWNGEGRMCKWQDDAINWDDCSWADNQYPKSVYNHGTSGKGVTIYYYTGWFSPIGGCVERGETVNLAGNYYIGSHRWDC